MENFCVDTMHASNLGVMQTYVAEVFWAVILSNGFKFGAHHGAEGIQQMTIARLFNELGRWYSAKGTWATRVGGLTEKMLGKQAKKSANSRRRKLKAH